MRLPIGKPISTTPAPLSNGSLGRVIFGAILAVLTSTLSVLALYFGLTGSSGNSLVTGAVLAVTPLAVGLLCFRRDTVLLPVDYLFFGFLLLHRMVLGP